MQQYNPRNLRDIVPTPLVSVGQLQQGINAQARNLENIGQGLENLARTKVESQINKAAEGLDFTDSQSVYKRLAPLLNFTTQESKANILDRMGRAGQDQTRQSKLANDAMTRRNLGSIIGERDTMLPIKKEGMIRQNEGASLRNMLTGETIQDKIQGRKWAKEDRETQQSSANQQKQMIADIFRTISDPTIPEEQKQKARDTFSMFVKGELPGSPKPTPFEEAMVKSETDQIKNDKTAYYDNLVDKFIEGYSDSAGNIIDPTIKGTNQRLVRQALIQLLQNPAYRKAMEAGDRDSVTQGLIDFLGQRGKRIEQEYDPDLFSPSTWFRRQLKIK